MRTLAVPSRAPRASPVAVASIGPSTSSLSLPSRNTESTGLSPACRVSACIMRNTSSIGRPRAS